MKIFHKNNFFKLACNYQQEHVTIFDIHQNFGDECMNRLTNEFQSIYQHTQPPNIDLLN